MTTLSELTLSPSGSPINAPASWLVDHVDLIPPGALVLDVASGTGRNGLSLARAGWRVHAVDRDAAALSRMSASALGDLAGQVTIEVLDLETQMPSLGHHRYGAVIVFNYLHRALMPLLVDAVAPGGVLIYETFTVNQDERGHPRNPAFLLEEGELRRLVAPLDILRSREGEFGGRLIASIVAARR